MATKHEAVWPLIHDDKYVFNANAPTCDKDFLKRHSFRVEETWDLNYTFATWLYEHLVGYVEASSHIVDLTFHTFKYQNKEYSQLELIMECKKNLEMYFKHQDELLFSDESSDYLQEATRIFAVLLPAMWW